MRSCFRLRRKPRGVPSSVPAGSVPCCGASTTTCSSAVASLTPGSPNHLRDGIVDVRSCALYGAGDFVDGPSCSAFQIAGCSSEWRDDLVDDLRVAVDRRQHPVDDLGDLVQPNLQQRLSLHPPDLQVDTAKLHVRADAEPEQVEHVGLYRDVSAEILDVEDDLVNPQLRYVEEDIRLCRRPSALTMPAGVARRSANSPVPNVSSSILRAN